jgi:hypothetical protein
LLREDLRKENIIKSYKDTFLFSVKVSGFEIAVLSTLDRTQGREMKKSMVIFTPTC